MEKKSIEFDLFMCCFVLLGDYECLDVLLCHAAAVVRSRACSMLGNMLKHSNDFYGVLKEKPNTLQGLLECLKDEDPNTRKVCSLLILSLEK